MESFFPTQSGAPQMSNYVSFSDKGLSQAGVQTGLRDYSDNYYNMQLKQYENDYNYWLWQQQAFYNSPAQQKARLQAAGLNPNFNSIEGAGNVKDTPFMKGDLRSNIVGNSISRENLLINEINSLLGAVKDGISATSELSGIPDDIGTYRQLLSKMLGSKVTGQRIQNSLGVIEQAFDMKTKLGLDYPIGVDTLFGDTIATPAIPSTHIEAKWDRSSKKAALDIRNAADSLLDDLRSGQININNERLKILGEQLRILQSNADYQDWKNGLGVGATALDILEGLVNMAFHRRR